MPRPGFDFLLSSTWGVSLFASFVGGSFLSEYQNQNILPLMPDQAFVLSSTWTQEDDSKEVTSKNEVIKNPIPKTDGNDEVANSSWLGSSRSIIYSHSIF